MGRSKVNGVILVPELFKITDTALLHKATRYCVFDDRVRSTVLLDVTVEDDDKVGYEFIPPLLYDDMDVYFTTNIQLEDDSWVGESPLTKATIRRDRDVNDSVILTPEVSVEGSVKLDGITLIGSSYMVFNEGKTHASTDFIVEEELTGKVVFKRENETQNLRSIFLDKNLFKSSTVYRLRIRYRDSAGRYSNYGDLIFSTYSILDILNDKTEYDIIYGTITNITAEHDDVIFLGSELFMDVRVKGVFVETLTYNVSGFILDTRKYKSGDILECTSRYNGDTRLVKIRLLTRLKSDDIDPNFILKGIYTELNANQYLLSGVSTSYENEIGIIYDINPSTRQIVAIQYNPFDNTLKNTKNILDISSIITTNHTYRTFIKNPLGGLILVCATTDGIGSQKLVFLSEIDDGLSIDNILTIPHDMYSITYNDTHYIKDDILYLHNREVSNNPYKQKVLSISLIDRDIVDLGNISKDNMIMRNMSPIVIDNNVKLLQSGLGSDLEDRINSMISSGETGVHKWVGCTYNPNNNRVYFTPNYSNNIMILDCNTNTVSMIPSGETGVHKWEGCTYNPNNNRVYFSPNNSNNIMILDCNTNIVSKIPSVETGSAKWVGCTHNPNNNRVYFSPHGSNNIMVLDCNTNTVSMIPSGETGVLKWYRCTYNPTNNKVYFTPNSSNNIMILDCDTNIVSKIPSGETGAWKWVGCTYNPNNNKVYFVPYSSNNIMILDCNTNTVSMIPSGETIGGKWTGCTYNPNNNKVYFSPHYSNNIMVLDCNTNIVSKIDSGETIAGKWYGCTYNPNNNRVYFSPLSSNNIMILDCSTNQNPNDILNVSSEYEISTDINKLNTLPIMIDSHLISRVFKLRNGNIGILYSPSIRNSKMGILEINPNTFTVSNKLINYISASNYRIVYYLKDGRIITANNDKGVLLS